ncbi:hypothetical protein NBRC116494_19610 [Aurantivibrio plasticivorans]
MKRLIIPSVLILPLIGCGGGGGSSSNGEVVGIGGTGSPAQATGSITGFGSIFVNGVEFETDSSSITIDDNPGSESDLKLGMVVTVSGEIDGTGNTGTATTVVFDNEVQGPVSSIGAVLTNGKREIIVLNTTVILDPVSTVFDDTSFDTIAVDDLVEVSGFRNSANQLVASRIERKSAFQTDISEVEIKGQINSLDTVAMSFVVGTYTVDYSTASEVEEPLSNGLGVEVKGTLNGTTITATRVQQEDDIFGDEIDKVSIEGFITNLSGTTFSILGQEVDASSATFSPASLVLANDLKVEVEGPIEGGVLRARSVEARDSELEINATVSAINGQTVTLSLFNGTVDFTVDNSTRMDDKTGVEDIFTVDEITPSDFLEVRLIDNGSSYIATEVRRDDLDDDEVQGPVDSFVSGSSITLFGITYSVDGSTQFKDANESAISSTNFFSTLQEGSIIKLQDELTTDGTADEVEFE